MSRITSPFSKHTDGDNDDESKVWIRSKPLLLCMLGSCYVLLIYCFGLLDASIAIPFIGIALGLSNRRPKKQGN
jgi:hypothetical protein